MSSKEKHNRRSFISSILTAGTAAGFSTPASANPKSKSEGKIKMLMGEA
jgi:hypothetical protein